MSASSYILPSLLDQGALSLEKAEVALPFVFLVGGIAYVAMANNVAGEGIGIGNTKWNVYSTLLGTLVGTLYWKEEISNYQLAGIGVSAIGLYLLGL